MTILSAQFLLFFFASLVVYRLIPARMRWMALLAFSLSFFTIVSGWKMLPYLAFGAFVTYAGARAIGGEGRTERQKKAILVATVCLTVGELAALKSLNIIPTTFNGLGRLFGVRVGMGTFSLIAPVGMSYYTLSLIGYVVDVYRGMYPAQPNFLKHLLFAGYYPALVSGPVMRYGEMGPQFFGEPECSLENIVPGVQRMAWGMFKKLVVADRLALFASQVFREYNTFGSLYIILAVGVYAFQIYADFSGCMDIVIGVSEAYGVRLPENFDTPFLSRSLAEFWRRWHITLGTWSKDYIFYPVLKSEPFQKLGTWSRKAFGKKRGKQVPVFLGLLVNWLIIGFWHGASYKYIFAAGVMPWLLMTVSELMQPLFEKRKTLKEAGSEHWLIHLLKSGRTLVLMCVVWLFASAPSFLGSFSVIRAIFAPFKLSAVRALDITKYDVLIVSLGLAALVTVDILKYRDLNLREAVNGRGIALRWAVSLALIFGTLIFGVYGPGYDAASFIYEVF
jgi:D-alanyl-lipoteichoic acid acyltransferase DltB (MBOAT superfamily)